MEASTAPSPGRSFFGSREDVEAHYACVFVSTEFADAFRPDADDIRQRRIDARRKPRKRKPSLVAAVAQAERSGLTVSGAVVNADGSIALTFGTVSVPAINGHDVIETADELLALI